MKTLPEKIDLIVFDFDGVFTDDKVITDETGKESVVCSRSDGLGIEMLNREGIKMLVISKERNAVVAKRCDKLKLSCAQGINDKLTFLTFLLLERRIPPTNVIYIGNDVNDLECMKIVGCSVCPSDSHQEIRKVAGIILEHTGGNGAVRELVDMILRRKL